METTLLDFFNKKKVSLILLAFALVISSTSNIYAQSISDDSLEPVVNEDTKYQKMLIVPFEERMYFSNIDGSLAKMSGKTSNEIRQTFRYNLQYSLVMQVRAHSSLGVVSLLSSDKVEIQEDLVNVYAAIGYEYKDMPVVKDTTTSGKAEKTVDNIKAKFKSFKKKDKKQQPTSHVTNGELTSVVAYNTEKYMATKIVNPELLGYLQSKYEAELFLFINQIDIKAASLGQEEIWSGYDDREVKVHFTIINSAGKVILSTAYKSRFSSQVTDMNEIISECIDDIAKQIAVNSPKKSASDAMIEKLEDDQEMMAAQNILGD